MKTFSEHQGLINHDEDHERDLGLQIGRQPRTLKSFTHVRQKSSVVLVGALILSISLNLHMWFSTYTRSCADQVQCETSFGHLAWDVETTYYHSSYDTDNSTEADTAWDAIAYNIGNIALDNEYVSEKNLPVGQEFPWDPEEKAVYFLSAYHSLHCLKSMRESMLELWDTGKSSYERSHTMHCFEVILNDIKCYADDTPLATQRDYPGRPGWGQKRQCRDWNKLDAFAKQNPGCWRDIGRHDKELDPLLRYRYCPKGSPYETWVHAVFGDFDENEGA